MLKLYESLAGTLVLSLRTGSPVAMIIEPIINPNNLYIEGWHVEDNRSKQRFILLSSDVREVLPQGFVINDYEVFGTAEDFIRLREFLEINFRLVNLRVVSENGKTYGKVTDYAFETNNFFIQKFYTAQSLVKNFSGGTISIDRSQIVEVTNRSIIIEDPTESSRANVASPVVG